MGWSGLKKNISTIQFIYWIEFVIYLLVWEWIESDWCFYSLNTFFFVQKHTQIVLVHLFLFYSLFIHSSCYCFQFNSDPIPIFIFVSTLRSESVRRVYSLNLWEFFASVTHMEILCWFFFEKTHCLSNCWIKSFIHVTILRNCKTENYDSNNNSINKNSINFVFANVSKL